MNRRHGLTIRWTAVAGLVALALSGCHSGSPASVSPTVTIAQSPDGQALAGVTQVIFTANASSTGAALVLTWDLGDGQTALGASVVHVYAKAGVFPVTLTASSGGGTTTTGSTVTVGSLTGTWLLSEGGGKFYERGFRITQTGANLSGLPYSVPDKGCLGALQGTVTSPRTVRFDFTACDGNTVVIDGTAGGDLLTIPGTYTHPDGPPQPIVLTRTLLE